MRKPQENNKLVETAIEQIEKLMEEGKDNIILEFDFLVDNGYRTLAFVLYVNVEKYQKVRKELKDYVRNYGWLLDINTDKHEYWTIQPDPNNNNYPSDEELYSHYNR